MVPATYVDAPMVAAHASRSSPMVVAHASRSSPIVVAHDSRSSPAAVAVGPIHIVAAPLECHEALALVHLVGPNKDPRLPEATFVAQCVDASSKVVASQGGPWMAKLRPM